MASFVLLAFIVFANTISHQLAHPITTGKCGPAHFPNGVAKFDCCPPTPTTAYKEFIPSSTAGPPRVRRPAHMVDQEYLKKYKRAVELMKTLPKTDPRSFQQQANVHCAYGMLSYEQLEYPGLEFQIHSSWLFFPWHRMYIYFYERILGELIGDPTFALAFWNWDTPAGMYMPSMYTTDPNSPLYDQNRSPEHLPPTLMNLGWFPNTPENSTITIQERISSNLEVMHKKMVAEANSSSRFLGMPYRAGDKPNPGGGTIETGPHGSVHAWTGDSRKANREDMGSFYSTARDPLFFSHHANIDRLWTLWQSFGLEDFKDNDWLETSFFFYDQNADPVRVKVKDCLDNKQLGYVYEDVPLPWNNI